MKSSMTAYSQQLGRYPLLSQADEERLTAEYFATRNPAIAKRLTEGNLRLVVATARSLGVRAEHLPDVIQEGNLGLIEAVRRFEPVRGIRFSTFATEWIRGSMLHCLTASSRSAARETPLGDDVSQTWGFSEPGVDVFMRKRLHWFMRSLRGRERDIFRRRIYAIRPLSLADLAARHRISDSRVCQIEQRIMRRLKNDFRPSKALAVS